MAILASSFIALCSHICTDLPTVYMQHSFGCPVTNALLHEKQHKYPSYYTPARMNYFRTHVGKGFWGFDAPGLIKGVLWGWTEDISKPNGGAVVGSNNVPDVGADSLFSRCTDISSDWTNLLPGEAVWNKGHIGVYLGEKKVAECSASWKNKCQISTISNLGALAGFNTRAWTKHGQLPSVTY
ncbi:putative Exo-glucosaminidase lytG precursor [Blattamonas nauphoetae]|uniref:Exo-glucosaminidase lytG n=1 Tax=Blattamonas nauphoetae TaxID=2049346 RepID=A0ABQ9WVI5_9EUKA|nr:putative Exo-glucosaminidase lytG precursor [Blattamonas nauphoetae]